MNTPDPPAPAALLTAEERELAQRLQRLGGQREPSAELDARIRAAARGALRAPASRIGRAPRRWPVALGVAASLVLAVGVAWQLRPLPDAGVGYSEVPATAPASTTADTASEPADASAGPSFQDNGGGAMSPSSEVAQAPAEARRQQPQSAVSRADAAGTGTFTADPAEAPIVLDDAAPMDLPAPAQTSAPVPAPAPPAPPASPPSPTALPTFPAPAAAPVGAAAAQAKQAVEQKARARGLARESDAASEAEAAGTLDRVEVSGSRIANDQPLDEQPPASADSPQVQQAWLQRIRELVARGELEAARASLAEYRRRHPLQALPDDLRALEE